MEQQHIGFIGGGRICRIFLHAFKRADLKFHGISVLDPNEEILNALKKEFPEINTSSDNIKEVAQSDIVFIAVHPPLVIETLQKAKEFITKDATVVSLAPKITIQKISETLGGFDNIARMIPSATAIILEGIHPLSFSEKISMEKRDRIIGILEQMGDLPEVLEEKLEAYALACGMGPTYFWFQWEKLKELAIRFGMEEEEAKQAISKMLVAGTNTLFNAPYDPEEIMDLIPVKPIGEHEEEIKKLYEQNLPALFDKIKTT